MELFQINFDQLPNAKDLVISIDEDIMTENDLEFESNDTTGTNGGIDIVVRKDDQEIAHGALITHDFYNAMKKGMISIFSTQDKDIKVIPVRPMLYNKMNAMAAIGIYGKQKYDFYIVEINPFICFILYIVHGCKIMSEIVNSLMLEMRDSEIDENANLENFGYYHAYPYKDATVFLFSGKDEITSLIFREDLNSDNHYVSVIDDQNQEIANISINKRYFSHIFEAADEQKMVDKETNSYYKYTVISDTEKNAIDSIAFKIQSFKDSILKKENMAVVTPINDEFELLINFHYTEKECKDNDIMEKVDYIMDMVHIML